jgi:hypothetical protein
VGNLTYLNVNDSVGGKGVMVTQILIAALNVVGSYISFLVYTNPAMAKYLSPQNRAECRRNSILSREFHQGN